MAECAELLEANFEKLVRNESEAPSIFDQEINWTGFEQNLEEQKTELEVSGERTFNFFENHQSLKLEVVDERIVKIKWPFSFLNLPGL